MTLGQARVSIGMPVYNGAKYLRAAIDSVLAQTYSDFELIISDNASSDDTEAICSEYQRQDKRVRYIRQHQNLGASRNYNAVFALAIGEYFRWAPCDDMFAPESLSECVAVLDAHPEVILCYPKTVLIGADGEVLSPYEDNLDLRSPDVKRRFLEALSNVGRVNVIYGLIRSSILRQTCLLGNYPGSDVVLIQALSLYGQFFEIPRQLFYRRMHATASSSLTTIESVQQFFDPEKEKRFFLYSWKHLAEKLRSIFAAPLSPLLKISVAAICLRSAFASRDHFWKDLSHLVRKIIHGQPIPIQSKLDSIKNRSD